MNDGLGVGGGQGRRHLLDDVNHVRDGQAADPAQTTFEILAIEKLHGQEGLAGRRGAEIQDFHDVRVAEPARDQGLAVKTRQGLGICRKFARHDLDGHPRAKAKMRRLVHRAHATLAHQSLDAIRALEHGPKQVFRRLPVWTHCEAPWPARPRAEKGRASANSTTDPPGRSIQGV